MASLPTPPVPHFPFNFPFFLYFPNPLIPSRPSRRSLMSLSFLPSLLSLAVPPVPSAPSRLSTRPYLLSCSHSPLSSRPSSRTFCLVLTHSPPRPVLPAVFTLTPSSHSRVLADNDTPCRLGFTGPELNTHHREKQRYFLP